MGRPKLPEHERPVPHQVRLRPYISDTVYHLAQARGVSQYQFLGDLIERVITLHQIRHPDLTCYRSGQPSSTLSYALSEPPS